MNLKQLLSRYDISKQTLYSRLKSLDLTLDKDLAGKTNASSEQVKLLDDLHAHIKDGGSMKSFKHPENIEAVRVDAEIMPEPKKNDSIIEALQKIAEEKKQTIIIQQNQERSPLWKNRELSEAAREGWPLTTQEISEIFGAKPRLSKGENTFTRGCWQFTKCGKIGKASAWRVEKNTFETESIIPFI